MLKIIAVNSIQRLDAKPSRNLNIFSPCQRYFEMKKVSSAFSQLNETRFSIRNVNNTKFPRFL